MEHTTGVASAFERLTQSLGQGPESIVQAAREMGDHLEVTVSFYRGMRLQLVEQRQPVAFTTAHPHDSVTDIVTSLELPVDLGRGVPNATVWMYAARPGAFVDLAADLAWALGLGVPCIRLDTDLPKALRSGVTGLDELSRINYAIGVLINAGCPVELALDAMTEQAKERGLSAFDCAVQLLASVRGGC